MPLRRRMNVRISDSGRFGRMLAMYRAGNFARIISKISALTILQYINFINDKPLGQIKHALL